MKRRQLLPIGGSFVAKVQFLFTNGLTETATGKVKTDNVLQEIETIKERVILNASAEVLVEKKGYTNFRDTPDLIDKIVEEKIVSASIIDWFVDYSKVGKLFRVKRVSRRGKYYNYITNRKTGRIETITRWSSDESVTSHEETF